MLRLKRFDFNVPGGYQYVQPETGMKFDGNTPFRGQVTLITTHRVANHLPRATKAESAVDLENYTCARARGSCVDGARASNVAQIVTRKAWCAGCGGKKKK